MRLTFVVAAIASTILGCAVSVDEADPMRRADGGIDLDAPAGPSGPSGSAPGEDAGCEGPLGFPMNPASLPACCKDRPGRAHCVASDKMPAALTSLLAKCEKGDVCLPDEFIRTGGVFKPPGCKSFGGDGVCLSLCIAEIESKKDLLQQDKCSDDERCVPCINPLDKKPTGACDLAGTCKGADAGPGATSDGGGPVVPKCPHEGPPVVDPKKLPACQCSDGRCVPKALVPGAFASKLADCSSDMGGKCVPDILIASGGDFIPASCKSVNGAEGRCLSTCLPDVASQAATLPQSTCTSSERCVPCFNPLDGKETGACRLSCDPGPKEPPPPPLPKCCKSRGTCVPRASVPPAAASSLQKDKCPGDAYLCAPDAFLTKTWKRISCKAGTFLGSAGPGVCMPECLKGISFLLKKGGCPSGMKCAPCKDPISKKPTGACEFSL